ncbi:scavenger receptor cysteine-rich type 1 protein M130-like isoform X2 [Scomber scombrus]|uniref:scavenger receptor cysteine-rich type 1 protein M130-like isoform X2 n=1 Tax=Scomber scombrus TaxID=13677 RepID=UPI002DD9CEF8|nr:scavenger receptor cysteine-rich type 1 protein M130-like isoform X2 [Scomber scombrus]
MLSSQWSVVFKWSFIGFSCFVLLTTKTSGASQSNDPVDARLVEGGSSCSGRLEMKYEGEWKTLTFKAMGSGRATKLKIAQVACRQMGCGSAISITHNVNNTNQRPAWEIELMCDGTELTLRECRNTASLRRVGRRRMTASSQEVVCSDSVRFGNGHSVCSGSLNVKSDNDWAPVCEEGFDSEARKVVCNEFGCGPPMVSSDSSTAEGVPALLKKFQCKGNESRLQDCASSTHKCKQAPAITCQGSYDVRLVGEENSCEGTLEGKLEGEWRPLAVSWALWKPEHSNMVCEKLGCGSVISTLKHDRYGRAWELPSTCWESPTNSSFCKTWMPKFSYMLMTVTCAENVRLVGGLDRCSGKLEIKSGPSWASVCQQSFTTENAQVTCAELGYIRNAMEEDCGEFRTEINCRERGEEPHIDLHTLNMDQDLGYRSEVVKDQRFAISCSTGSLYKPFSMRLRYRIGHRIDQAAEWIQPAVGKSAIFFFPAAEDAHQGLYECDYNYEFKPDFFSNPQTLYLTVKEHHDVRLVDGHSRCAGRLEVEHQEKWRSVSYQHSWSLKEAAVVCRQLGCGAAVSTSKVDDSPEVRSVWRFYSDCEGSERALMECGVVKNWSSSSTIEVACTDILHQPNITIISGLSSTNSEGGEMISMGHSITINCSVEPQYPGGHFSLKINSLNQTHSLTQPAVNHSAVFTFTATEGNCSCVYHNFLFNHNFSSESLSLLMNITDYIGVMLDDENNSPCSGKLLVDVRGGLKLLSAESTVWDLKHASVVCRQLGCGAAISTNNVTLPTKEKMARFYSDCDGSESALLDCGTTVEWFSSSYVQVNCTGETLTDTKMNTSGETLNL